MKLYDISELAVRRHEFALLTTKYLKGKFRSDGTWLLSDRDMGMRELMFCTNALFESGNISNIELANRIIQKNLPGYRHCHFMPFTIAQCYWHFEPLLEKETKDALDEYFLTWVDSFMAPGMDFVGANDNFPCMATATALFAAERYGYDSMGIVRKRLMQLRAMAKRSDYPCEYNSPTYTSVSLIALAEVASHAPDNLRELALGAEAWFWNDLLTHFHLPTAQMAPPYSRAYPIDYTACTHHARFSYYALFGDKLPVSPVNEIAQDDGCVPGMVIHHDPDFLRISCMWTLLPDYHCPEELAVSALDRAFPCVVEGSSDLAFWNELGSFRQLPEISDSMPKYYGIPFQSGRLYTYMSDRYVVGSVRYPFLRGDQTSGFQVNYVKDKPAERQSDVKTVFSRYVVNDVPIEWDSSSLIDFGQKLSTQRENSVIQVYWPSPANNEKITSLKLTINISALYDLPDEVWLGDRRLDNYSGESEVAETVFVRDGEVYMSFRPLMPWTADSRIRVRAVNRVLEISFISYEGEPRDFPREQLLNIINGVAAEIRDVAKDGSFEEFRRTYSPVISTLDRAGTHHICYENGKCVLGMQYNTFTRSIRWVENDSTNETDIMRGDLL